IVSRIFIFFFSSRRRHTRSKRDWSSDVCSSDLQNFIDQNLVVLEVKINNSVPLWLTRILQALQCAQRSASKYCTSMELLQGHKLPTGIGRELVLTGGN